jgi:cytochrome c1
MRMASTDSGKWGYELYQGRNYHKEKNEKKDEWQSTEKWIDEIMDHKKNIMFFAIMVVLFWYLEKLIWRYL